MSISLNKLNKPGMNTSFGTSKTGKTGVTAQATKNMANYSSAGSSSIFKLNAKHSSNWVPGVKVTPNQSKHNYQGVRQSLNARGFTPSVGLSGLGEVQGTQQFQATNKMGAYQKGQMIGQLVNGTFGMLNKMGVFDGIKGTASKSASEKLGDALKGGNGPSIASTVTSSSTAGAISAMEACNDSASLRGAIGNAEAQLRTMQGQTADLKGKADVAEKDLKGLESTKKQKENDVKDAKQNLSTANRTVEAKTNIRDTKKLELQKADANYTTKKEEHAKAQANTASAQAALSSAEATLESTPKQIDGPNGTKIDNPAYETAKKAVDDAKAKLKDAQEAEKNAKSAMDAAKQQADAAGKGVTEAEENLKKAEEELKGAETKQKEAEENLKKAKEELEKAKQDVADANSAIETFKRHEQDVKELESQIQKQNKRLEKMQEDELKDYAKYNDKAQTNLDKANELAGKIVGEVDTRSERRASKGIDKANDKAADAMSRRDALSENVRLTNLLKKGGTTAIGSDNNEYRLIQDQGQTYYFRNGQQIEANELPDDIKTQFGAQ